MAPQPQIPKKEKLARLDTVATLLQTKGYDVWNISPDATVYEAIERMALKHVGALPVMSQETLVGIISERDYARKVILQGRSSQATLVRDIMTPSPIIVAPHQTVHECLQIMTLRRIRHLPVVDDGNVSGIISIGDLVKSIIETQEFTIDQLHTYITDHYPV